MGVQTDTSPPPMAQSLSPFTILPRTLRRARDPQLTLLEFLPGEINGFLLGADVPGLRDVSNPPILGQILLWRLPVGEGTIDPEYLVRYRARWKADQPLPLAVEPRWFEEAIAVNYPSDEAGLPDDADDPDWLEASEVQQMLARRLERHWQVEWADLGARNWPPVLYVCHDAVVVLGSALPPRSRAALAAFSVFPMLTADELNATVKQLTGNALEPAELSRVLTYGARVGLLAPATADMVAMYWRGRPRPDRGPLRVFASAATALLPRTALPTDSARALQRWYSTRQVESDGELTRGTQMLLDQWKERAAKMRASGVRTI